MEKPALKPSRRPRFDKPALKSRKFVAYLLAEASWKAILFFMIWQLGKDSLGPAYGIMLAVVIVAGFLEVGFILGQAYVDKFVRVAEVLAHAPDPAAAKAPRALPIKLPTPVPAAIPEVDDGQDDDDGPEDD